MALYLGHLATVGRSMATIEQARAAVSHFHAVAGMQRSDNPARHPVVAEAVRGWRNRAPAPRQADALTGALLDQLTHHVHILEMNGESYRLKLQTIARKNRAHRQRCLFLLL